MLDFNLVSQKDVDIRLIEAIFLSSRFLSEDPHFFQLDLLSRFSRATTANSPVIDRMVKEAAAMVLLMSKQCLAPLYPCVSSSSPGIRLPTQYLPTHVLAVTTIEQSQEKGQPEGDDKQKVVGQEEEVKKEEDEDKEKAAANEDSSISAVLAVVWGARCGLQIWSAGPNFGEFHFDYHICDGVSLSVRISVLLQK